MRRGQVFFLKGEQAITLHEIIVCTSYTTILERTNTQADGKSPPSFRVYSREDFRARFPRTIPFETNISGLFSVFFFCRNILNLAWQVDLNFWNLKFFGKKNHGCTSPLACVQTSPLPLKKIGRRDFFQREGGRLYTGYSASISLCKQCISRPFSPESSARIVLIIPFKLKPRQSYKNEKFN